MLDNPLTPFLATRGFLVLDGGLATTLEARGHELDPVVWSARLLRDDPDAIRAVHRAFLDAGADCIISASYQASLPGFARVGVEEADAVALLRRSSELALAAREQYLADHPSTAPAPLVAASVGPYGAYLADGSEYDGRYGTGRGELDAFHRRRFELLASTGVDLLACETIPSRSEAGVLVDILEGHPDDIWAWMTFSCADGARLHDGTPIEEAVALCGTSDRIAAVGVNCTAPEHVEDLVGRIRTVTDRHVIVYANSGEAYDATTGTWADDAPRSAWLAGTLAAWRAGAKIVGGCCRVGPEKIAELRRRLEAGTRTEGAS